MRLTSGSALRARVTQDDLPDAVAILPAPPPVSFHPQAPRDDDPLMPINCWR
ncbi:hypothetical protein [Aquisediminimonas sediminicola]|uniref:hypothetical protein n=1 Tax=Alteraquisediminimonas sediminicola TaxID=2676787 RepID=UPI001C8E1888|nr:hypothetical protein [Aquisediminimonas sediminicola]